MKFYFMVYKDEAGFTESSVSASKEDAWFEVHDIKGNPRMPRPKILARNPKSSLRLSQDATCQNYKAVGAQGMTAMCFYPKTL